MGLARGQLGGVGIEDTLGGGPTVQGRPSVDAVEQRPFHL